MTCISEFPIYNPVLNFISKDHQGDELTLVAACRDVLHVVSAQERSDYKDDIGPVIEKADDISQRPGEVWTDRLPAYRGMEHDHRYIIYDEECSLRIPSRDSSTDTAGCNYLKPWCRETAPIEWLLSSTTNRFLRNYSRQYKMMCSQLSPKPPIENPIRGSFSSFYEVVHVNILTL